ncbi:hypothetical protein EJ06DRAFT_545287 [Trichodelitschia bisporula]|uniref:Reverse transcriptase domain-containing protein n=1 Tax=Trichodelitschia bisporula TaxID=703511 RepID=A0A6G1HJL7_9PEZI|nr:hypothetical protein EJ06DRAFT_545287 [Trichodelitschia bisporula]
MAPPAVSILNHFTAPKLQMLETRRAAFQTIHNKVVAEAKAMPNRAEATFQNLKNLLLQATADPSISKTQLDEWWDALTREFENQERRYEYAVLFRKLVNEWVETSGHGRLASPSGEDFEPVGRKEMHEQRAQWEKYAITEKKVDREAIRTYLEDLFGDAKGQALMKLREKTGMGESKDKKKDFKLKPLSVEDVELAIAGVLQSDIFTGQKRQELVKLQIKDAVLAEIADVVNMDLTSLDSWQWEPNPMTVQMRRQLNGIYRAFYDEEIHVAILLYYIGCEWGSRFNEAFKAFYKAGWIHTFTTLDGRTKKRWEKFIGKTPYEKALTCLRETTFGRTYFMSSKKQRPVNIKEAMHRLATTEMLVNSKLHGQFTMWATDFKWFGPSMSHETVCTVLEFLGVSKKWLAFFKRFLSADIVFEQDGPNAQPQTRKCGLPLSHVLSDTMSEAVLFYLDYAINKWTYGSFLYRFHDVWFWGQESKCIEAWKTITEFSKLMGLELNESKTGCVHIVDKVADGLDKKGARALPAGLPQGDIVWGLLRLDGVSGRWLIDTKKVDEHVAELGLQLKACRSVFAWIQAWNGYFHHFFRTNFGRPAECFGQEHVRMVIKMFQYVHSELFGDEGVTSHLRAMIGERSGMRDLPEGFFQFPVNRGGLQLCNPFLALFAVLENTSKNPAAKLEEALDEAKAKYKGLSNAYEIGEVPATHVGFLKEDELFISLEKYMSYAEDTSEELSVACWKLTKVSEEEMIKMSPELMRYMDNTPDHPYWRWALELYGPEVIERFGGLQMGERELLPLWLVAALRSERTRWQG